MSLTNVFLILTTTLLALIAGLLYAYSCSVNPGLGCLGDDSYILAMQSINRQIQNPVFFLSFMGTLLLLPFTCWLQYREGLSTVFYLLTTATLIYIAGVFLVTMIGNVPLNNALDKFDLSSATMLQIKNARSAFEGPWGRLHTVRTIAAIVSLILVITACVQKSAVQQ